MTTPVRYLYVLRHAKSSWDDPTLEDHDRPLSPRGRKAARKMAEHVRDGGIRPAVVLCSSALRARETLERVLPALGEAVSVKVERSLYGADEGDLLAKLRRLPVAAQSALLIGHNPALQYLTLTLAGRSSLRSRVEAKFPTGALATLRVLEIPWKDLAPGRAELVDFVAPKDL